MTCDWLKAASMTLLAVLGGAILWLISDTFHTMMQHVTPDGKVPLQDAGILTALLLSFREVLAAYNGIWQHAERVAATEAISNSVPTQKPNPPVEEPA